MQRREDPYGLYERVCARTRTVSLRQARAVLRIVLDARILSNLTHHGVSLQHLFSLYLSDFAFKVIVS